MSLLRECLGCMMVRHLALQLTPIRAPTTVTLAFDHRVFMGFCGLLEHCFDLRKQLLGWLPPSCCMA
jgi:hypothetical protein